MRPLILLFLISCGRIAFDPRDDAGAGNGDGGSQSGSRLKIVWNEFPDGTRTVLGTYDSLRQEACTLGYDEDTTRCVPAAMDLVFGDASCTQQVGRVYDLCSDAKYIAGQGGFFVRGAQLAQTSFYADDGGGCAGPYTGEVYALGAEVPIGEFAAVTRVREPTSNRLARRFYESDATDDDFRIETTTQDTLLSATCSPGETAAGRACVPNDRGFAVYYEDPACTVNQIASPAPPPRFAVYDDPAGCPLSSFHYYSVTVENTTGNNYYAAGGSCLMVPVPMGSKMWSLGAELQLAPLTQRIETVAGRRLQHVRYQDGATEIDNQQIQLYDTTLDTMCTVNRASDGVKRCVPDAALSIATYYADAGCTTAIELALDDQYDTCAVVPDRYGYKVTFNGSCDTRSERYDLGAVYTGTVYQMLGTCTPRTVAAGITPVYYQVGPQVPPTTFAPATAVTDP